MKRRKLSFRTVQEAADEVDRLAATGYDRAGTWNLAQNCDHLTKFMTLSLDGFGDVRFPWLLRTFGPLMRPVILRGAYMPAGLKGPPQVMPAAQVDELTAVAAFHAVVRRAEDPAATFVPSPVLGKLTPDQWRRLHCVHCGHHLGFLVPRK